MKVFDKGLIDELETELLNQYLNIVWLEDYLNNGFKVELVIKFDMEGRSEPKTIEEWREAPIIGVDIKTTADKKFGSKIFKQQLNFTGEEYDRIYQEMGESCKEPRYDFLKKQFGYSIGDLISFVDQLAVLRKDLETLNDKENAKSYKEILHGYIGLDTLTYGIMNPSLKRRIAKGRSIQGEYQKIVKAKKKIFFDLLLERVEVKKSKYKNVSQAVNNNMKEVMHRFQIHDKEWIKSKQRISLARIIKLKEEKLDESLTTSRIEKIEKEIVRLTTLIRQLDYGLSNGYPFETLDNILPFNTVSLDEVLMKTLRLEKSIKEQCIESS